MISSSMYLERVYWNLICAEVIEEELTFVGEISGPLFYLPFLYIVCGFRG